MFNESAKTFTLGGETIHEGDYISLDGSTGKIYKGDIKTVSMMARKQLPTGYARIILDYNKKGLPVRMVLDEFAGIETEYTFKY